MKDQELRKAGLKVTGPRIKVLSVLENNREKHLTAEDVYRLLITQDEDIGLATVYRVLTQFEAAGILRRHNFEGGSAVFELEAGEHHDHLVCVKCGNVQEFYDDDIEQRQQVVSNNHQFEMTDHSLTIYGVCSNCR